MLLEEAYRAGQIDRFEMMELAEILAGMSKEKEGALWCDVELNKGVFSFKKTFPISKKDSLLSFSLAISTLMAMTDKRLASIFMNHYLACINDIRFFDYMPKSKTKPFIMACGGLSGSGKSRVARELAPLLAVPFGCIVLRDDIVRKQIAGVPFSEELGPEFYTPEFDKKVYKEMRRQGKHAIQAGYPIIVDGLFVNPKARWGVESEAKKLHVPFIGFWMDAPLSVRAGRVTTRKKNPSDVKTKEALIQQQDIDVGDMTWNYILTDDDREKTIENVLKVFKKK